MSWSFLTQFLDEISNHSTFVGKIWLIMLIVFRIVLTAVAGETIFNDEQSNFVCNTLQPGCQNVCYDAFAPLSQVRFWIFQVIMVTIPTIMYLGFAMHKISRMDDSEYTVRMPIVSRRAVCDCKEAEDNGEVDPMFTEEIKPNRPEKPDKGSEQRHDGRRQILRDGLMKAYMCQLLVRSAFEGAFLFSQYILYGFEVSPSYLCTRSPCPYTVDCFVSRPTEKTIFLYIMYAVSLLCLLITILEIVHLAIGWFKDSFCCRSALNADSESTRAIPTAPQQYHATKEKLKRQLMVSPMVDSVFDDDHPSSAELERLCRDLKRALQQLDLAKQIDEISLSRNSNPVVNTAALTVTKQERLRSGQRHGEISEKGIRV